MTGDLMHGVSTKNGGTLRIETNCIHVELPEYLPEDRMDNRLLKVCKGLQEKEERVILVTKDILLRMKALYLMNGILFSIRILSQSRCPMSRISTVDAVNAIHHRKISEILRKSPFLWRIYIRWMIMEMWWNCHLRKMNLLF